MRYSEVYLREKFRLLWQSDHQFDSASALTVVDADHDTIAPEKTSLAA